MSRTFVAFLFIFASPVLADDKTSQETEEINAKVKLLHQAFIARVPVVNTGSEALITGIDQLKRDAENARDKLIQKLNNQCDDLTALKKTYFEKLTANEDTKNRITKEFDEKLERNTTQRQDALTNGLKKTPDEVRSELAEIDRQRAEIEKAKTDRLAELEVQRETILAEYAVKLDAFLQKALTDETNATDAYLKELQKALAKASGGITTMESSLVTSRQNFEKKGNELLQQLNTTLPKTATGKGILATLKGTRLRPFPIMGVKWSAFYRTRKLQYGVTMAGGEPTPELIAAINQLFLDPKQSKGWSFGGAGELFWNDQRVTFTQYEMKLKNGEYDPKFNRRERNLVHLKLYSEIVRSVQWQAVQSENSAVLLDAKAVALNATGVPIEAGENQTKALDVIDAILSGSQYGVRDIQRHAAEQVDIPGLGVIGVKFQKKNAEGQWVDLGEVVEGGDAAAREAWVKALDVVFRPSQLIPAQTRDMLKEEIEAKYFAAN